ncbi:MAG: hypothetical protein DLM63_00620 [Solirubrobacterales bacterium]|nr:MAG: hypothetical protein DLM63_00620 [Solirubrobacterales bacterium]
MGTLLELQDPVEPLRRELRERAGLTLDSARCQHGLAAEIAYYRAHHDEGDTEPRLVALRRRCAGVLRDALGPPAQTIALEQIEAALRAALRFRAHADAAGALDALHARGLILVAVSNWDRSLHQVLATVGLASRLDGVVTSAQAGASKPDPAIFARALELAGGIAANAALHVGDRLDEDVEGARAAGLRPVLLQRCLPEEGSAQLSTPTVTVIRSLSELPALVS